MIEFEGWRVPPGFKCDGCTGVPDRLFSIDLEPACILHDFMRRHAIVPAAEADKLFRRHMIALGAPAWLARLFWLVIKVARPWFYYTEPVPTKWLGFTERFIDTGERRRETDFL